MKIAIDISPLKRGHYLQHRVRGTGFYLENLKKSLLQYFPNNKYIFFIRGDKLPKDVNLVHYPYFEPFFLTLPAFSKYKTAVTVHDLTPLVFPKEFPLGLKGKIKWQLQKVALRKAKMVITDSESSKKDIVKFAAIPNENIQVIYLAAGSEFKDLDLAQEKQNLETKINSVKRKYGLPDKFVLYVGDATWNKNLPRLVESIKLINLPLVMVGKALIDYSLDKNNPWNKDLVLVQKLAENDKQIMRLGFIPSQDLVLIYNLATVFAMPSLYEGFGLPILEAMSCGCPVVASKEGSLPEIAGPAAYYVDAYSVRNIAEGIAEVFYNPKLQKDFSSRGLKWAKNFTWKKTTEKTMRVYKMVSNL